MSLEPKNAVYASSNALHRWEDGRRAAAAAADEEEEKEEEEELEEKEEDEEAVAASRMKRTRPARQAHDALRNAQNE